LEAAYAFGRTRTADFLLQNGADPKFRGTEYFKNDPIRHEDNFRWNDSENYEDYEEEEEDEEGEEDEEHSAEEMNRDY
jgi:hypothetical protein